MPEQNLAPDARHRAELVAALRGGNARVATADALQGIPFEKVNERIDGLPYALWGLVEHLRRTQDDILDFIRDPDYQEKDWPADYWPEGDATEEEWNAALAGFLADLDSAVELAETADLTAEIGHAPGYTVLRELYLIVDHNAYHLGEVLVLRRLLGIWK